MKYPTARHRIQTDRKPLDGQTFFSSPEIKMPSFQQRFTLEQRIAEAQKIRQKYPDRVPCIVERNNTAASDIPDISKHKYLVPDKLRMAEIMAIIRKRMGGSMKAEQALFLFVHNDEKTVVAPAGLTIGQIDEKYRGKDGFVYIQYTGETTFGK